MKLRGKLNLTTTSPKDGVGFNPENPGSRDPSRTYMARHMPSQGSKWSCRFIARRRLLPNLQKRGILDKAKRGILNPRTAADQGPGPRRSRPVRVRGRLLRPSGPPSWQFHEGRSGVAHAALRRASHRPCFRRNPDFRVSRSPSTRFFHLRPRAARRRHAALRSVRRAMANATQAGYERIRSRSACSMQARSLSEIWNQLDLKYAP